MAKKICGLLIVLTMVVRHVPVIRLALPWGPEPRHCATRNPRYGVVDASRNALRIAELEHDTRLGPD